MPNTKKWFLDRIGKTIYRDNGSVFVLDIEHAKHLFLCSDELGIRYSDSITRSIYCFAYDLKDVYGDDIDNLDLLDFAYPMSYWKELMVEKGIKQLNVVKAKKVTGIKVFYCKEYLNVMDVGDCGRTKCNKYIANNGRGGRCKSYGYCYEKTDDIIKIEL